MIKVLFLDIDGVLNSNFWNANHQREISDGTLIDKEKVKLLALLVKRTDAKIILHSGWRIWFDTSLKPLRIEAQRLLELLDREGLCIKIQLLFLYSVMYNKFIMEIMQK
ncbi:MAG: HAD domain-containing protein [Clostridium sp.]|nr:HAD domain-containing protein [Clostridium sp.]